jgi:hypothetical protein
MKPLLKWQREKENFVPFFVTSCRLCCLRRCISANSTNLLKDYDLHTEGAHPPNESKITTSPAP